MAVPLLSPLVALFQRLGQSLLQRRARPLSETPQYKPKEFFLDPDEAKTLGNLDYMRTARTVRKTFPKMVGTKKETLEIIESISATEKVRINSSETESSPPETAATGSEPSESQEASRRRANDDLNPWRSMAREIRK